MSRVRIAGDRSALGRRRGTARVQVIDEEEDVLYSAADRVNTALSERRPAADDVASNDRIDAAGLGEADLRGAGESDDRQTADGVPDRPAEGAWAVSRRRGDSVRLSHDLLPFPPNATFRAASDQPDHSVGAAGVLPYAS